MNTRREPLYFDCREQARDYAKTTGIAVWAKVWSWTGVFHIYPGGREVWYNA